jgi:hypothetical protein
MADSDGKPTRTWQEITAEAGKETDPLKVAALTEELERALAERDARIRIAIRAAEQPGKRKAS